jgi:hypothetical protein
MATSGFLSSFQNTLNSPVDLLSLAVTDASNGSYSTSSGNPYNYSGGYFNIGNILVQFTNSDPNSTPGKINNLNGGSIYTITFPMSFSDNPWALVASPSNSSNENAGTITVYNDKINKNEFEVYVGNGGGVGLNYIAIGPGPPS